jgi:hypothetical protein
MVNEDNLSSFRFFVRVVFAGYAQVLKGRNQIVTVVFIALKEIKKRCGYM